jgi:hypothetical protein
LGDRWASRTHPVLEEVVDADATLVIPSNRAAEAIRKVVHRIYRIIFMGLSPTR